MGCRKLHIKENYSPLKVVHRAENPVQKVEQAFFFSSEKTDAGEYCYGFQGQEADDEIRGKGNSVNYKYRMHDALIGRFFAVDPLAPEYPHNSPYAFSENRVVDGVELEGLEFEHANKEEGQNDSCGRTFSCATVNEDGTLNQDAGWVPSEHYSGAGSWGRYNEYLRKESYASQGKYQELIAKGVYVFTEKYGWVDRKHAFSYTDKEGVYNGTKQLWAQLENEDGIVETRDGVEGFKVTYAQSSFKFHVQREFWVKKGLSVAEKEQIAVTIVNFVSNYHEGFQLNGSLVSSSGYEPSDMPSNVLGLYQWMRGYSSDEIMTMIGAYNWEISAEVYDMYPGTFGDKYKNYSWKPLWFKSTYSSVDPNSLIPDELNVPMATFGNNFQLWDNSFQWLKIKW